MHTKEISMTNGDSAAAAFAAAPLAARDEATISVGVECAPGDDASRDLQPPPIPWYKQNRRLLIAALLLIAVGLAIALGLVLGGVKERPDAQSSPGRTFDQSSAVNLFPNGDFVATPDFHAGVNVAILGDTAVVGAPLNDDTRGSAYVFERDANGEWSKQDRLVLPDGIEPASDDGRVLFGNTVAISDDIIIVGTPWDLHWDFEYGEYGVSRSSAYIFEREGVKWIYKDRLATDEATLDVFGYSIASHGQSIAVGAPLTWGGDYPSAYVFARSGSTWIREAKLSGSEILGFFAGSVDIHDDLLVVGALQDEYIGTSRYREAVNVFARKGANWIHEAKLHAPADEKDNFSISNEQFFGFAVGVYEDVVVVGAPVDNGSGRVGNSPGSAYVFARERGEWTQQAKLNAPGGGAADDHFGRSVAIDCELIVIGAGGYDLNTDGSGAYGGSAYVFAREGTQWVHQSTLVSPKAVDDDDFGRAVAVHNGTILVGSSDGAYIFSG